MIVVVSRAADPHADAVLANLTRRGRQAALVDLSTLPNRASLTMHYPCCTSCDAAQPRIVLRGQCGDIDMRQATAVWWRRPQHFDVSALDGEARAFAYNEWYEAVAGMWAMVGGAFWVNDPQRDLVASRKAFQLQVALEEGLSIPETLITSDPRAAAEFVARRAGAPCIYKSFSATERAWRETRILTDAELSAIDQVRWSPVIFQEYVPADVDVRVIVVGDDVYAGAIHSQDMEYRYDYRMHLDEVRIEASVLPTDVTDKLLAYMRRLGLEYGAIDMRRTPDGDYVFLEVNPAGQWLFVEQRTGLPIAARLADLLTRATP